ncbi:MAG: hypothetical protein MJD61_05435 [Proteobacteria bacterium]|nr:hypothetical protein [Pseudomonadota bacterium]
MYKIWTDEKHAIVQLVLDGFIRVDEMRAFVSELRQATLSLQGREIKIRADVRGFHPASPEVADMIRAVQEFGLRSGVKRVAEIVGSQTVALQLNRVARESGTHHILRRFWEEDSAAEWLLHGDPAD